MIGVAETRARQVRMVGQYMLLSRFLFLMINPTRGMGVDAGDYIPIRVVGSARHPLSPVTCRRRTAWCSATRDNPAKRGMMNNLTSQVLLVVCIRIPAFMLLHVFSCALSCA